MLFRTVFAAASLLLLSGSVFAAGEAIGIPACDDFLAKYQACVTDKVPADEKAMMQSGVDGMRNGWLAARDSIERQDLENICKQASTQMKQTFDAFGCAL
ncbi:MAG: hypothetical protein LBH14_07475 [Desulfobulbaceae bacterium]|jgi:hypothetical protein|nr:hypothetical protein [Desulfobulbaceae bacterium]